MAGALQSLLGGQSTSGVPGGKGQPTSPALGGSNPFSSSGDSAGSGAGTGAFGPDFVKRIIEAAIQGSLLQRMQAGGVAGGPPQALPAQGQGGGLSGASDLFRNMIANPTQGLFTPPVRPAAPVVIPKSTPTQTPAAATGPAALKESRRIEQLRLEAEGPA